MDKSIFCDLGKVINTKHRQFNNCSPNFLYKFVVPYYLVDTGHNQQGKGQKANIFANRVVQKKTNCKKRNARK